MINDLITDIIRWGVGLVCVGVLLFIVYLFLGLKIEFMGILRCTSRDPISGERCALHSKGHLGVKHRDRSGRRTWW